VTLAMYRVRRRLARRLGLIARRGVERSPPRAHTTTPTRPRTRRRRSWHGAPRGRGGREQEGGAGAERALDVAAGAREGKGAECDAADAHRTGARWRADAQGGAFAGCLRRTRERTLLTLAFFYLI
jgi:hypothetical protein